MEKSKNKIPIQKYRNSEELVQNMIIEFTKKNHVKFSKVILQEMRLIPFWREIDNYSISHLFDTQHNPHDP